MKMDNETKWKINNLVTFNPIDWMDAETFDEFKNSFLEAMYAEYEGVYHYVRYDYIPDALFLRKEELSFLDDESDREDESEYIEERITHVCDARNPDFSPNTTMDNLDIDAKYYANSEYYSNKIEFLKDFVEVDWYAYYETIRYDLINDMIPSDAE